MCRAWGEKNGCQTPDVGGREVAVADEKQAPGQHFWRSAPARLVPRPDEERESKMKSFTMLRGFPEKLEA